MDEEDDLEMLRQAALRTLVANRNNKREQSNRNRITVAPPRVKTNGNLIEIQPTEIVPSNSNPGEEGANLDDYIVEEFVLDGSDASVNSSDCDEVIEEMIVSDAENEVENTLPQEFSKEGEELEGSQQQRINNLPTRSNSSHQNSSDDESDALSIKSSYSLIMDDDDNEFQSLESKFLSKKVQKQKDPDPAEASSVNTTSSESRRKRSRSPLPFRTRPRRSRSRSRSRDRNRIGRSRSPLTLGGRRRNHSPVSNSRGGRRSYRTNSSERRRRRTPSRTRSPSTRTSPSTSRSRLAVQNNRLPKSRSPAATDKTKAQQRSSSHTRTKSKSPVDEKQPEKLEKLIKNLPPEEVDRLEKRRKKFEGESEVSTGKKVIKIANKSSTGSERQSSSTVKDKKPNVGEKSTVLKEKVQKTSSKRTVELVVNNEDYVTNDQCNSGVDDDTQREEQEDLRTRLIKKKLEKMHQTTSSSSGGTGGSSGSGSSGPSVVSSVVVVSTGSQRIFSQALKNSQIEAKGKSGRKRSKSPTSSDKKLSSSTSKITKVPKSEVKISNNIDGSSSSNSSTRKKSRDQTSPANKSGVDASRNKSKAGSGPKRVVSVTYS